MIEQWKEIKNTEGKYYISNFGRLKTTDRNVRNRHNKKRFVKGMIRKTTVRNDGYCIASFYLNYKRWSRFVHHLVWEYFGDGSKSDHKMTLDHIDNNKLNNRIDNLQIIPSRMNTSKGLKNKKNKASKYIGVTWLNNKKRWRSRILVGKERKYLGSYKTEYEAHLAYQNELGKL